jgi:hypothetical protein
VLPRGIIVRRRRWRFLLLTTEDMSVNAIFALRKGRGDDGEVTMA